MRDFFKPWRRKIGVVALGLACVFSAGWARSLRNEEVVTLRASAKCVTQMHSCAGILLWETYSCSDSKNRIMNVEKLGYASNLRSSFRDPRPGLDTFCGLAYGNTDFTFNGYQQTVVKVRYCVIAIPLTLLSAWLLLSKPRPIGRKQCWRQQAIILTGITVLALIYQLVFFGTPLLSAVIPLIVLSAYLLLSKPRHSAPKQTTEPVPTNGA